MTQQTEFERSVFVNCPFDEAYAPLLEAALFCIIYFGFVPRLASESLEGGENRLDKIVEMIQKSKYSIHDLSRCQAEQAGGYLRMNMPFELGIDLGFRRGNVPVFQQKKFLIFEKEPYDLKRALSDIAGQDVAYHRNNFELIIKNVRDFFRVEALEDVPGPAQIETDYATFQGWMIEKKIFEGHSETQALHLPTSERLEEMKVWVGAGRPSQFGKPA